MKVEQGHTSGKWRGLARKLVCGAATVGMVVALVPANAFATDITSKYYALPSANSVKSFEHPVSAKDSGNGHAYTYRYVTVGGSATGRVAPMMQTWYEVLGLNYADAYTGVETIYGRSEATSFDANRGSSYDSDYTQGSQGSLSSRNSTLAIMTGNNENPDEYIWNYCAWANGADVPVDSRALDHGNSAAGSYSVSVGGSEYSNFPREVYMECDILGAANGTSVNGKSPTALSDYSEWVKLENQRANRPKTGTYDPTYAKLTINAGGGAKSVQTLATVADAVDKVIAQKKDENGNHPLQTRYGGNTDNGTSAVVAKYEDVVQATQYYTLSKIADGTVKKATTATLVGYDPQTGNYACRKSNVSFSGQGSNGKDTKQADPDTNYYGGRVANYLADISNNITDKGLKPAQKTNNSREDDFVVWYTPEQIVENCDAAFVCDAYSANTISDYLATAQDGKVYTVYTPTDATHPEEDNTDGLVTARNKALKAGTHAANFCFSYPCTMFGNFYAQGVENGLISPVVCAFTYPKIFDLTDMLGYWARNIWHIKSSAVRDVVTAAAEGMDLSGGQKIGSVSSNYQGVAQNVFNAGNQYYLKHTAAIDKINNGNMKTYSLDGLKARTKAGIVKGTTETAGSKATKASYKATGSSTVTFQASQSKSSKSISVPATVKINEKTYKVTAVAANAFKNGKATSVTLGANVKSVGSKAFNNMKKLAKVTIGKNVTKLSKGAFYKTPKLKTITVKSKSLTKKSAVKNALKGSKVAKKLTVKHSGVSKKQLKKSFTKKNLGSPVAVNVK